ncbi:MAG TPA: Uma2 family endonuclease, partial [Sorangium sp.]|nr:Uma2 family endonuclease [Sorangium sp.]
MGHPAEKRRHATYADLEAVPPNKVAELVRGTLHVFPRPAPRHANAASSLGADLHGAFQRGRGGPGGWWILDEPELHFPDPDAPGEIDALVPDLAGWRRERMPELPETAYFPLAPDWICEVLSASTEGVDRDEKMPVYAREGVRHAWLVDPIARTLEVYALDADGRWGPAVVHREAARVRAV